MFIAMSAYIENPERFQINNVMIYLKFSEEQEQVKPKAVDGKKG
jgi:hypothetical protein